MANFLSKAIIIGRDDFKENDLIVLLYTQEFGKLKLIAKGAKKFNSKLAAHVEPISLSEILIVRSRSNFDYLAAARNIYLFKSVKEDWDKMKIIGEIFSIFNKSVKFNEPDIALYNWFLLWLKNLIKTKSEESEKMKAIFLIRFFSIMGYEISLNTCSLCNQIKENRSYYFDFSQSKLHCSNCLKNRNNYYELSENSIKLFNIIQNNKKTVIAKKSMIHELNKFLYKFWQYQDL